MTPLNPVRPRTVTNRSSPPVGHGPVDPIVHLTPRIVAEWESQLGVERQRLARPTHFAGAAGMREWWGGVDVVPHDIHRFRAVRFDRELSMTAAFCSLHSAMSADRTAELVNAVPLDALLVTVTSMRGTNTRSPAECSYSWPA